MTTILQRAAARPLAAMRDLLYPMTCPMCDARVEEEHALCPSCWADTPFIHGASCDLCGVGLPGTGDGTALRCDDCMVIARPWDRGRAVLGYAGSGRRMVLALKHGDRTELAKTAAHWMHRRARDMFHAGTIIVPVPIHRLRLMKRRYNQSALMAQHLARLSGGTYAPFALTRTKATPSQDHRNVKDRFANLDGAINATGDLTDADVVLVDDVMTSGATFAACADALRKAGARRIDVVMLARVAKDP